MPKKNIVILIFWYKNIYSFLYWIVCPQQLHTLFQVQKKYLCKSRTPVWMLSARWFNFLLRSHDVFLQVAVSGTFSKFRHKTCTFCLDPHSCLSAYGTALFGPIECEQLLLDVSCVSMHSKDAPLHIWLVVTRNLHLLVFKIRGRTVKHHLSCFGLSN